MPVNVFASHDPKKLGKFPPLYASDAEINFDIKVASAERGQQSWPMYRYSTQLDIHWKKKSGIWDTYFRNFKIRIDLDNIRITQNNA